MQPHIARQVAPHAEPPLWLRNWEDSRPIWLMESKLIDLEKKLESSKSNHSVTNVFLFFLL